MKKKFERLNSLINILKENNGASVRELSAALNVSDMTIRRDLELLKHKNLVINNYGAFFYNYTNNKEIEDTYALNSAAIENPSQKYLIGRYAAGYISEQDILIIDTGTTTEAFAREIPNEINATILCYNRNILNLLYNKPNISLIFAGGYYHPNTEMFESSEGLSLISHTRANKVFISAAGIHETLGVTCSNNYEIAAKQAIFKSGVEKILLADSSKFSVVKSSYFANLCDFDTIITDSGITDKWIQIIKELGITLHIA